MNQIFPNLHFLHLDFFNRYTKSLEPRRWLIDWSVAWITSPPVYPTICSRLPYLLFLPSTSSQFDEFNNSGVPRVRPSTLLPSPPRVVPTTMVVGRSVFRRETWLVMRRGRHAHSCRLSVASLLRHAPKNRIVDARIACSRVRTCELTSGTNPRELWLSIYIYKGKESAVFSSMMLLQANRSICLDLHNFDLLKLRLRNCVNETLRRNIYLYRILMKIFRLILDFVLVSKNEN